MIDGSSPIAQRWRALTPRERTLTGAMLVIGGLLAAFYLGIQPGLAAMESAQSRSQRAAADLGEVRRMAADLASVNARIDATPLDAAARAAEASAIESGLRVVAINQEEDGIRMVVSAPNSAAVLAWAAETSDAIAMGARTLSIQPVPGAIEVDITFTRETP